MAKAASIMGLILSLALILLFALDLAIGIPFQKTSTMMDVGTIVCAAILAYMSWTTFRELP